MQLGSAFRMRLGVRNAVVVTGGRRFGITGAGRLPSSVERFRGHEFVIAQVQVQSIGAGEDEMYSCVFNVDQGAHFRYRLPAR